MNIVSAVLSNNIYVLSILSYIPNPVMKGHVLRHSGVNQSEYENIGNYVVIPPNDIT